MQKLTDRQKFIFDFIKTGIEKDGDAPTIREIQAQIGCSSPMGVVSHLKSLERKGFITREEGKRRGISISDGKRKDTDTVDVPLVGNVACGMPIWAEELVEDRIPISKKILRGDSRDVFMLRAKGDSMNLAGIDDGDYIIVKRQDDADNNDKVVVLIGTEATAKKMKKFKDHVEFHSVSTNGKHKPIIPEKGEFMIQGKIIGNIKNYT